MIVTPHARNACEALRSLMSVLGRRQVSEEDIPDDAEIDTLVREAIAQVIGDSTYAPAKVAVWSTNVVEGGLKRLAALSKPFK